MDRIGLIVLDGSSGLYRMDRIGWIVLLLVLVSLGETGFYALAGLLLAGGTDGLDETLVGWGWDVETNVSRRRNRSTTIGS